MARGKESLQEFYAHKFNERSEGLQSHPGQFQVFRIEDRIQAVANSPSYIRRDFYKIMLFKGENVFHYGDQSIAISGHTLMFFNPLVPYTYDPVSPDSKGYFCVFDQDFFAENYRPSLDDMPLFNCLPYPIFQLKADENAEVEILFEKIIKEIQTVYRFKFEMIKNYVCELIYMAMKLQPLEKSITHVDAGTRITAVFRELLDRQFPIASSAQRFGFRSPKVCADRLSIHVNSLNRAIKKTTGRTTTELIFERLVREAKALLQHTHWNISEISYVLGFEGQANFNNFFKKQTGQKPSDFRRV